MIASASTSLKLRGEPLPPSVGANGWCKKRNSTEKTVLLNANAQERTRTSNPITGTTTSRWRVYQFRHLGRLCEKEYIGQFHRVDLISLFKLKIRSSFLPLEAEPEHTVRYDWSESGFL